MEDNNILDPILDFVSNLFSTKPSDLPKPTPLDVQNLIRDPELAEEKGLKTKYPLEKEGNVDKNTPVKNDLLPDVGQPDNDSSRSGDQTVPKIQQQPPKEIGSGVQDKKQEDGNTIISEDEDNTKTPENKEIKQEKSEVKEELPKNEKSKEEKPKTHDEPISENKEHKPEVQDENKELKELPQNEKSKEEKPKTHDEPISESKEYKPEVQDENPCQKPPVSPRI
uniref:Uncharacterized protein n=1 Tax=Cacopsylla melanoneura TaxID=428564 RepID=A0A8D9BFG9_9HEMI